MGTGRSASVLLHDHGIRIPGNLAELAAFRAWARSEAFPERGRIDWIAGEVEVDMSPEDINTHGTPKSAIARTLGQLVDEGDHGVVLIDATRVSAPVADLSAEPDVVVVLFRSIDDGRVRLVPKASGEKGRFVEVEGAADLVVECVSDSSVTKDTERLFERYQTAGVREYWLVDARREEPSLALHRLEPGGYVEAARDAHGFARSAVLGLAVRLVRLPPRAGLVRYRLEHRPGP